LCRYLLISVLQPTGKESLVEQWILHKLNVCTTEINAQLEARDFMRATTAAYGFWLYELCDVYIVGERIFSFLFLC
jgi:valyl-tRNA synthetase